MRSVLHRVILAACLVLILLAAPASAAGAQGQTADREPAVFTFLWRALQELAPVALKSSGTMDPDGRPLPPPPDSATQTDSSGTICEPSALAVLGNARRLASDSESPARPSTRLGRILEEEGANDALERAQLIGLDSEEALEINYPPPAVAYRLN